MRTLNRKELAAAQIAALRARFDPGIAMTQSTATAHDPEPFVWWCVGKALCWWDDAKSYGASRSGLPSEGDICGAILSLNPMIGHHTADKLATAIVAYNDHGDTRSAWEVAQKALEYDEDANEGRAG